MADEKKPEFKATEIKKGSNVAGRVEEIGKDVERASDKLHNLFKECKVDPILIQSGVAQMVKQAYQALSDLEMALTDIGQRTKEAEKRIAAAEATK